MCDLECLVGNIREGAVWQKMMVGNQWGVRSSAQKAAGHRDLMLRRGDGAGLGILGIEVVLKPVSETWSEMN